MSNIDLVRAAEFAIDYAKKQGMDQTEVALHQGVGVSITARQQELETVEKHNDAQLVVSVYKNNKTGSASSADMSEEGIRSSVNAAMSIAKFTGADSCLGLADKDRMATEDQDLGLHHPWDIGMDEMVDTALRCESSALGYDKRIENSEGATVSSYSGNAVYANSHGFLRDSSGSQHSISCSVIGADEAGMQRDYWYDSGRNAAKLADAEEIGKICAQRTIRRLGAKQIESMQAPVMFDPLMAKSLIGHLVGAIKGGAIYKKASFMLDKVGQSICPDFVSIAENPHKLGGASSSMFDGEGVATPEHRSLVKRGDLQGYVLGSYTARKLGMESTANAGGVRNLSVSDTGHSFEQILKEMGTGLLVTELIGSGINMVTGDYSRGAAGFWVENGELIYPVEEITIAGNLTDIYQNIVCLGNDRDSKGNIECGSILIGNMTVAGS